jgi:hypothetical protein
MSLLPTPLAAKLLSEPSDALDEACKHFQNTFTIVPDGEGIGTQEAIDLTGEAEQLVGDEPELWEAVADMEPPVWASTPGRAPMIARALAVLLLKAARHQQGPELHAVALFVAALRACGHLTRFVANFEVCSTYLLPAYELTAWWCLSSVNFDVPDTERLHGQV